MERIFAVDRVFPGGLPNFVVEDDVFSDDIAAKLILYPTDVCMLTEKQFLCLQNFLRIIGEEKYIITDSFLLNGTMMQEPKWIEFSGNASYSEVQLNCFNPVTAFCSINATWGIVISDEEYAVVGCREQYANHLLHAFCPCKGQRQLFAEEYAKRADLPNKAYNKWLVNRVLSWVPPIAF